MLGDLKLKARMTTETLNSIEGISCNEVMGAMYAFPQIKMPQKALQEAQVSFITAGNNIVLSYFIVLSFFCK